MGSPSFVLIIQVFAVHRGTCPLRPKTIRSWTDVRYFLHPRGSNYLIVE